MYNGDHFFVDCLASHAHDHHFTRAGWEEILTILDSMGIIVGGEVKKVVIWSDGGLKTKENLFTFRQIAMKRKVEIKVNFLGPYHGHSEVQQSFFQSATANVFKLIPLF